MMIQFEGWMIFCWVKFNGVLQAFFFGAEPGYYDFIVVVYSSICYFL